MRRHFRELVICLGLIGCGSPVWASFSYTSLASDLHGKPGSGGFGLGGVAPVEIFAASSSTVNLLDIGLYSVVPESSSEQFTMSFTDTLTLTEASESRLQATVTLAIVLTFSRVNSTTNLSTATINGLTTGNASFAITIGETSYTLSHFVYQPPTPSLSIDGSLSARIDSNSLTPASLQPALAPEPASIVLLGLAGLTSWVAMRGRVRLS